MVSELEKPTPAQVELETHRSNAKVQNISAVGISLVVHLLALGGMAMIHHSIVNGEPQVQVESIFTDEPQREEFEKVLEVDTTPAETLNNVAGGVVSTQVASGGASAGSAAAAAQQKIESSNVFKDPSVKVNVGDISAPSTGTLGEDLGETGVMGEGGAFVEGYGAALGRITQELLRLMRSDPVTVVWLFDESESMKDDQKEIRDNFQKVYVELGLASKKDNDLKKKGADILLTTVVGYGAGYHELAKTTSDVEKIKESIDKIAIDDSGKENTCQAIQKAIDDHRAAVLRGKRKLVVIVVSDESGDDGDKVEDALQAAKKAQAPIYIMGREAIFGYKYARIRWQDPKYKLWHWLPILRGPETAFRECLQWDGLHARWDSFSSGFGPYEQVRLAKESGGVFFVLPGEEENLSGAGAHEKRQFDALDMKEYEPLLISRRQYAQEVTDSKFRMTMNDVIRILDPEQDKELNIRELHYSLNIDEFKAQASQEVVKAARAMSGLNQVIPMLENAKALRAREQSERWRAHYDLMLAQCYAYRVRLFQYLLAMDGHVAANPKPKSQLSNEWNVGRRPKMIEPDEAQYGRIKGAFKLKTTREEYQKELKEHEQRARELFEYVITEHPRTPWARRAQYELGMGFGMQFYDAFRDPNYQKSDIKVPNF